MSQKHKFVTNVAVLNQHFSLKDKHHHVTHHLTTPTTRNLSIYLTTLTEQRKRAFQIHLEHSQTRYAFKHAPP
uniref:Histone H3.2 histone H3.1 Major histone H3 n=1 Tax=Rhizophora mucronata TaxID=61149 RepID=A0A2P2K1F7_RHIMU